MQIQFDYTVDDFVAFNRYCSTHLPDMRRRYWIFLLSAPLAYLAVTLVVTIAANQFIWWAWLIFFGLLIVWPIRFPPKYKAMIDQSAIAALKRGQNKVALGRYAVSISENALTETTTAGESCWLWRDVKRVEQNETYLYLFINDTTACVVPKRAFVDHEQMAGFYAAVSAHVERAKAQDGL